MKLVDAFLLIGLTAVSSCSSNDAAQVAREFTGSEAVYKLLPGSQYAIFGTVVFKERVDGTAQAEISMEGTTGALYHPVHIHFGDISEPDAELVAQLNPVYGKTGKSSSNIIRLADESVLTYADARKLSGCIKVHLSAAGPERDIILAAGNIGQLAPANGITNGPQSVGICKSE